MMLSHRCARSRNVERHRRVEDAGAVTVHGKAGLTSGIGHVADLRRPPRPSRRGLGRVLDRHEADGWLVVDGRLDRPTHDVTDEETLLVGKPLHLSAGIAGRARHLVADHVGPGGSQRLAARTGVEGDGRLVAHRPRRHVDRCRLAHHLGRDLLEPVDRRVLAVDVVADLSLGHGPAHLRRRPRDRVGAEVGSSVGCSHGQRIRAWPARELRRRRRAESGPPASP